MSLSFDGKVAVITGAGGGLGRSHALEIARRGGFVVVNDLGGSVDGVGDDDSAAQQVVEEIKEAGGEAVANFASVATPEGGASVIQTAIDTWGRVDVVINNAGILRDTSFAKMTPEQLEPVLDVHLKGAFYVTQPAFVHMKEQGYGRIVNTASGAGIFGNFGQSNYGAAKMGLVGLINVLAVEGAKYDIKANAIAPVAGTRMTEDILGPLFDQLGPEYITPVAVYLASEDCDVTGEIYTCGGGHVARVFIGVTPGFTDTDLSVESIAENLGTIRDEAGYEVPANLNEELGLTLEALS
ncbi:MAG: SDR family oxidoreductase [Acidimicrobiales bacterium]|nr:SDR family oxidoreductase [Acidimicrobiales bacterium]